MSKNLPGIIYTEDSGNTKNVVPIVDAFASLYQIPFFKDDEYFSNIDSYTKFIKGAEWEVRHSDRYSAYKKYLQNEAKLDHCQVFVEIGKDDADIEMHHGPVFTLYDYCTIILEWFLLNHMKVTTFRIADVVLKEHEENHIQVVMLSTTIHEQVHNRGIFISMDQAFGDINAFIHKYYDAIGQELREKYNRYLDRSRVSDSNDYGLLELTGKIHATEE